MRFIIFFIKKMSHNIYHLSEQDRKALFALTFIRTICLNSTTKLFQFDSNIGYVVNYASKIRETHIYTEKIWNTEREGLIIEHIIDLMLRFHYIFMKLLFIHLYNKIYIHYLTTDKTMFTCIMPPLRPMLNSGK